MDTAVVKHFLRQAPDHSLLVLDTKPQRSKIKSRFIFDVRRPEEQECEELVKEYWNKPVAGSRMYKVQQNIKWCKLGYIRWKKRNKKECRGGN